MSEGEKRRRGKLEPWIQNQLAVFHQETAAKLELAPDNTAPIYRRPSDGETCRLDDWWVSNTDAEWDEFDLRENSIRVEPTSVVDTEEPRTGLIG